MANSRIKDIATTAAAAASDDYLVIDGATNGTRKIAVSNVGGGGGSTEYDFTTTLTPSIDTRGVSGNYFYVYPTDSTTITIENAPKLKAYSVVGSVAYPLIVASSTPDTSNSRFYIMLKSLFGNPQGTTSTTVSGTLHIVAPFEISNVTAASM